MYNHLHEFDDYLAMVEAAPELYGDVMAAPSGMRVAPETASPDRVGGAAPGPAEGMVPVNLSGPPARWRLAVLAIDAESAAKPPLAVVRCASGPARCTAAHRNNVGVPHAARNKLRLPSENQARSSSATHQVIRRSFEYIGDHSSVQFQHIQKQRHDNNRIHRVGVMLAFVGCWNTVHEGTFQQIQQTPTVVQPLDKCWNLLELWDSFPEHQNSNKSNKFQQNSKRWTIAGFVETVGIFHENTNSNNSDMLDFVGQFKCVPLKTQVVVGIQGFM